MGRASGLKWKTMISWMGDSIPASPFKGGEKKKKLKKIMGFGRSHILIPYLKKFIV